jgi:hypothetical protein
MIIKLEKQNAKPGRKFEVQRIEGGHIVDYMRGSKPFTPQEVESFAKKVIAPPKKPKTRNYRHDYYRVDLPGDCAETIKELGHIAIREAEERTKIYAMPCNWIAKHIGGEIGDFSVKFRVCRIRGR